MLFCVMQEILLKKEFVDSYKLKKFSEYAIKKNSIRFPVVANKNLASIVSFITFDGHLTLKEGMFTFTAGATPKLLVMADKTNTQFGIIGKLKQVVTNEYGTSYEYRFSNKPICRILALIGTPTGNKTKCSYLVPNWIKSNKQLSYAYLKTAFECEGGFWKEPNRERVRFAINKEESRLEGGINFLNELKSMLKLFDVATTNICIKGRKRATLIISFDISAKSIETFKRVFNFV